MLTCVATDVEPSSSTIVGESGLEHVSAGFLVEGCSVSRGGSQDREGGEERSELGESEHCKVKECGLKRW